MPRYRPTATAEGYDRTELVRSLVQELNRNGSYPIAQPLIYEEPVPQTNTYHVIVIWDRWADVPSEQRGSIILDAYEQFDPDTARNVTIALGATVDEAIDQNLLPYQIVSMARQGEADPGDVKRALLEEGAVHASGGLVLALPAEAMAHEVHRRLEERLPQGHWGIQRNVARVID
jgi:hypothetical protein